MARRFILGTHFERFVDRQVASGRYKNATEVIRAAVRLLQDDERRRTIEDKRIRRLIRDADRNDTRVPFEETFARLERRYARNSPQRQKRR